MEEKRVSIIIPLVLLNDYVFECLEGCLTQNYANFELVLLPDVPIQLPEKYSRGKVRVVVTGDVTIAKKRNRGMSEFPETDFFAFIDSDACPSPDWLKNAVRGFSISGEIWAVGGPNISPKNESIREKVVGNAAKSFLISGGKSFCKKISKSRYCVDLPTCNLIIKREVLDTLKGFEEDLITGEDIELCRRVIEHGGKILYRNKVVVYHRNRQLFKPFVRQRITYGFSAFQAMKKKLSLSNLIPLAPFMFLIFLWGGYLASIFSDTIRSVWMVVVGWYLMLLLIETLRYSSKVSEIPLTFMALVLGNLTPGIGSLIAFLRPKADIAKIYRNYGQ